MWLQQENDLRGELHMGYKMLGKLLFSKPYNFLILEFGEYIEITFTLNEQGARIGDHFIRGCADDRCDIQIGLGSYIESKCCYNDKCNNERFFFPNNANERLISPAIMNMTLAILIIFILVWLLKKCRSTKYVKK